MSVVRLRATWVAEYDANPAHYVLGDRVASPAEMAKMDMDPGMEVMSLMADANHVSFTVVPVVTEPDFPTSQHLDGDPGRSMQEGLVDP